MGIDGGFIPKRTDILPSESRNEREAVNRERTSSYSSSYWTICALSGMPLKSPIFVSITGAIFNKEEVLSAILNNLIPKKLSYLKHLKYLKEIDLQGADSLIHYVCPLSNRSPSEGTTDVFIMLWKCGHLFLKSTFESICKDHICPICGEKAEDNEIIELSGFKNHDFIKNKHKLKKKRE